MGARPQVGGSVGLREGSEVAPTKQSGVHKATSVLQLVIATATCVAAIVGVAIFVSSGITQNAERLNQMGQRMTAHEQKPTHEGTQNHITVLMNTVVRLEARQELMLKKIDELQVKVERGR
jgi:hypothetical protein